jgi:hypothetical protein
MMRIRRGVQTNSCTPTWLGKFFMFFLLAARFQLQPLVEPQPSQT